MEGGGKKKKSVISVSFDRAMIVGAWWAVLSISISADVLGFSPRKVSGVYSPFCNKGKTSS